MCRIMIILFQWDFNKKIQKLLILLLYTSANCSRKFHAWVQSVNERSLQNTHAYGKIYIFFSPNKAKGDTELLLSDKARTKELWCIIFPPRG